MSYNELSYEPGDDTVTTHAMTVQDVKLRTQNQRFLHLHYPQCSSTADSSVADSDVLR